MKFFFHSDIDDHTDSTGHKLIEQVMMISRADILTWSYVGDLTVMEETAITAADAMCMSSEIK
jgi:hypothetical protein